MISGCENDGFPHCKDIVTNMFIWEIPFLSFLDMDVFRRTDTYYTVHPSSPAHAVTITPLKQGSRYEGFVVVVASTEPFRYPIVYFFQITSILLGIFPYIICITVVVMYAIREAAVKFRLQKRESALHDAKLALGVLNDVPEG